MPQMPQAALAALSHGRFWTDGRLYERKLDGRRCLAVKRGSEDRRVHSVLRHPRYLSLRGDKPARDMVREAR